MAAIVPVHEQIRGLVRAGRRRDFRRDRRHGRAGQALSSSIRRGRLSHDRCVRRRAGPCGHASARRAAPARRQIGQPPGADAGRAGERREPDRRRRRRCRRPLHGRDRRRARRDRRAGRRGRPDRSLPRVSPGADGLTEPDGILDCGNSGTSLRLITGILAGLPMTTVLDGDASLRRRPVARIIEPLRRMGAVLHARRNDSLPPLTVVGHTPLRAIDITTPVPSAQVKSAILLAGLRADGRTTVRSRSRLATTRNGCSERGACRSSGRTCRAARWPGGRRRACGAGGRRNGSRATSPPPRSGSSPARSIPTPSSSSAASA